MATLAHSSHLWSLVESILGVSQLNAPSLSTSDEEGHQNNAESLERSQEEPENQAFVGRSRAYSAEEEQEEERK